MANQKQARKEFFEACELMRSSVQTENFEGYAYTTFIALAFGIGEFCSTCMALHVDPFDKTCTATPEWIEMQICEQTNDEEDEKAKY